MKITRIITMIVALCLVTGMAWGAGAREAAQPDSPIEIWMNTLFHGGDAQAMEMLVRQFNESHGTITIDLTQGSWTEYFAQLNNSVVAGEAPQIGIGLNFRMLDIYPALTPLNDSPAGNLLERFGFRRSDYVEAVWDIANINGNQYGIPLDNAMLGIYYNKDIFRAAGLDPERPLRTMDEFVRAADAIRDAGFHAFHPGAFGQARWYRRMWYIYLWQKGGELIQNERAAFNTPAGREALEFLVSTRTRGWNQPGTNGAAQFDAGELGMMVNGTWHYLTLAQGNLNWGFMPMPKFFDHHYTWGSNHFLVIPRQSGRDAERQILAAAEAIKWMSENSHTWGIYGGHVPMRRSALDSPALRQSPTWNKTLEQFTAMSFGGVYRPEPIHPKINQIGAALEPFIEEAYNGTLSVADALRRAEQAVNEVLRN